MAEAAVKFVGNKLMDLLKDEFTLAKDVDKKLKLVTDELDRIQAYLKDADAKAEMGETREVVKTWVRQMREVSFHIEDAIDEYLFEADNDHRGFVGIISKICELDNDKHDMCGFFGVISKIGDLVRGVTARHKFASHIEEITSSIENLKKAKETFELNPSPSEPRTSISTQHCLRRKALYNEDDQLVGIEVQRTKHVLTDWLLDEQSGRTVISVVGEGGLGKTTIVNKVFNQQKGNKSFECFAWITVSQSLKGDNLLQNLLRKVYEEVGLKNSLQEIMAMNNETLVSELRKHLQQRSYMIVFDDVWEVNFWGDVMHALPRVKGRIIITTRNSEVAKFCGSYEFHHEHIMKLMHPNDAWILFRRNVFSEGLFKDLDELSKKFVKKCNGLPLAILAMSGLLSTKNKNVSEWQRVYDSLLSKLPSDPHLISVHEVLSESYQDLNYRLKSCLLYFGLFPEDYSIDRGRLIQLWIAEDFVENKGNEGQTLEEVAKEYLEELVARNLVKVEVSNSFGRVDKCWVHDLVHDFILKKCMELNFCQVKKSEDFNLSKWTRRLSIDTSIHDVNKETNTANYGLVRSCLLFNIPSNIPFGMQNTQFALLLSSFKFLVRLDCEGSYLGGSLPEAIGYLFHLRYLNLKNSNISRIPKSIGKLHNLETLNLKGTRVYKLPSEIYRLTKLQHLVSYRSSFRSITGTKFTEGIKHLNALQTLCMVDANANGDGITKELKHLKQMRKLGVTGVNKVDGKSLCNAIQGMTYLSKLTIVSSKVVPLLKSDDKRDHESLDWEALIGRDNEALDLEALIGRDNESDHESLDWEELIRGYNESDHEEALIGRYNEALDLEALTNPPMHLQRLCIVGKLERLPHWIPKIKGLVKLHLEGSNLTEDPLPLLQDLPELSRLILDANAYEGQELHFRKEGFINMKELKIGLPGLETLKIDEGGLLHLQNLHICDGHPLLKVPIYIMSKLRHLRDRQILKYSSF